LLSMVLFDVKDDSELFAELSADKDLSAFCDAFSLRLKPVAGDSDRRSGRRILPRVPDDYRHVMTANGIGVLAPNAQFDRDHSTACLQNPLEVRDRLKLARYLSAHCPASALVELQVVQPYAALDGIRDCFELLMEVYASLGRRQLADRVRTW